MERADGTQARLKHRYKSPTASQLRSGKGGWDSGEIETSRTYSSCSGVACGKGGWDSGEIETCKSGRSNGPLTNSGKGGWDSGEIETPKKRVASMTLRPSWKGRMGLRRD